ncbi:MAG: hypothetical protein IT454_20070 [Planctomycetes bacterium]|nr:hypothetical protein [Planctomycetota bacterium]
MKNELDHSHADRPTVRLVGANGNAINILGLCFRAARGAGWSAKRIAAFRAEATSGDYGYLHAVVRAHFEVK